jgi:hypothetical protein
MPYEWHHLIKLNLNLIKEQLYVDSTFFMNGNNLKFFLKKNMARSNVTLTILFRFTLVSLPTTITEHCMIFRRELTLRDI